MQHHSPGRFPASNAMFDSPTILQSTRYVCMTSQSCMGLSFCKLLRKACKVPSLPQCKVSMYDHMASLQERLVDGHALFDQEGPCKTLQDLWDGEQSQDTLANLQTP